MDLQLIFDLSSQIFSSFLFFHPIFFILPRAPELALRVMDDDNKSIMEGKIFLKKLQEKRLKFVLVY